jgi:hypothetical protein
MGRPEFVSVVLAVIRGLLMDLDATGDTTRTDWAFNAFLDTIRHPAQAIPQVANQPTPHRPPPAPTSKKNR